MDRQIDNNTVFVSATEPVLYDGCDFRLYWAVAGICFLASVCLFAIFPLPASLYGIGLVVFIFLASRWGLREMAKVDPLAVPVYLRHIQWPDYLPAKGKVLKSRRPFKLMRRRA
ncbi:MAG: hypothetical protein JWN34_5089 [Bryobacterales bacterium]|jgi:type IV secretory pathway TrbD component|nr:hypothetical protein [Bryobacterales bacterium]